MYLVSISRLLDENKEVELRGRKKELETKLRIYQNTFKVKVELINSSIEKSDIETLNIRINDFDEELLKLKGNLETFPDNQRIKDFISEQEKILLGFEDIGIERV